MNTNKQSHLIHYQVVITFVSVTTLWDGEIVLELELSNIQFTHILKTSTASNLSRRVLKIKIYDVCDTFNNIKIRMKRLSLT